MKTKILESAKSQHVAISERECEQIKIIQFIVRTWRQLDVRNYALSQAGFYPHQAPAKTGHGVGSCFQRMSSGKLRVRVSHSWSGKFGNYAWVCDI